MNTTNTTPTPEVHPCAGAAIRVTRPRLPLNRRDFLARASMFGFALLPIPREGDTQPSSESATMSKGEARYTWCFQLEILSGLEIYLIGYEGRESEDGDSWNRFLTDSDRRLLYCTDRERIWEALALGCMGAGRLANLSLDEIHWASIPYVLEDLREGRELSSCGELFYGIDALTDIVPSCGYSWNEGLCGFLMGCWSHMFESSSASWEDVISSRGYKELTVEEGIQIALGIIVSSGRCVVGGGAIEVLTDSAMATSDYPPERASEMERESDSLGESNGLSPAEADAGTGLNWWVCLEVSSGLNCYFHYQQGYGVHPEDIFLTDAERRILFCTDYAMLSKVVEIGTQGSVTFSQLGAPNVNHFSIPRALELLRSGVQVDESWELLCVCDVLDEFGFSNGGDANAGCFEFIRQCYDTLYFRDSPKWNAVLRDGGYKNLTVEEGLQLALGIVLTQGRYVA